MARVVLSEQFIREAMQKRAVRDKLDEVRDRVAARAETIASSEGLDPHIATSSGTRPKGRPYSRVTADADQEFGNSNTARRRILGRAAEAES